MMFETNLTNSLLDRIPAVYVIATGAGAGFQKQLWDIPGASAFLVGAEFPYKMEVTSTLLGFTPEHFVSEETSLELAMAAYMKAYDTKEHRSNVIGIGLSGSVASLKEHRGDHRVFASVISDRAKFTLSITINKGKGQQVREEDGLIADELLRQALLRVLDLQEESSPLFKGHVLTHEVKDHSDEELTTLIMKRPYFQANGLRTGFQLEIDGYVGCPRGVVLYPGTFNPLHLGHKGCADNAEALFIEERHRKPQVVYATCINPAHKPPPTAVDLLRKASQMKGNNFLLTQNDALYIEKARAFPFATFVIGADVLLTLLDPKWTTDPKALIDEFVKLGTRFYVVGRVVQQQFVTLYHVINQYPGLLPEDNFQHLFGRWDISSTELRNQK